MMKIFNYEIYSYRSLFYDIGLNILRFVGAFLFLIIYAFLIEHIGLLLFGYVAKGLLWISATQPDSMFLKLSHIQWDIISCLRYILMVLVAIFCFICLSLSVLFGIALISALLLFIAKGAIALVRKMGVAVLICTFLLIKTGCIFYTMFITHIQNIVVYPDNMALYYTGAAIIFIFISIYYGIPVGGIKLLHT